jgi:hypothetical protein
MEMGEGATVKIKLLIPRSEHYFAYCLGRFRAVTILLMVYWAIFPPPQVFPAGMQLFS